ncbi:100_t:CDS:2 [Paraglomus occultum]|uniref:100_t:CDS:1 n=1 Tax=Paraglomus occultum TaxID=144539 RepID=A0A9N8WHH7_9GLOM|nr:100_t:CDS:2 [Paraglomus occultum]
MEDQKVFRAICRALRNQQENIIGIFTDTNSSIGSLVPAQDEDDSTACSYCFNGLLKVSVGVFETIGKRLDQFDPALIIFKLKHPAEDNIFTGIKPPTEAFFLNARSLEAGGAPPNGAVVGGAGRPAAVLYEER